MAQSLSLSMPQPARKTAIVPDDSIEAASAHPQVPADHELVSRALAGDKTAEELLYRNHAQAAYALAARLLGRSSEAEDVVQDAFVTVLGRLHQLRDRARYRAWLLRIIVHEVHRRYRRRRLLRVLGMDGSQDDDTGLAQLALPGLGVDQRAELAGLDRVLGSIPSRERIAWMLRHVEGYELTEVAEACETSLATAKRWIAQAQARLYAHITPGGDHD
jgi:RNA polymerase sigma-70 factor (ECF subfamily)